MVATKILNGIEVDGTVKADEFVGILKGNATSATSATTATTATTASKLSSNAGSATKPIYFENGVPKVTTYELNKTVPADAKFTDTTYSAQSGGGLELSGTEFSVKTGFTASGKNYAVVKDAAGDLYVNVPWTDTQQDISGLAPLNSPALTGTPTAPTATTGTNTTQIATTAFVKSAIDGIPTPMRFMGTVGTGGTITSLPTAASGNNGYVYKAITAGTSPVTYAIGDTLVSNGSEWTVIPSGDEPSGTVTNVATGTGLTGGPITSTGTISLAASGVTAGSYGDSAAQTPTYGGTFKVPYVTVDTYGRVTSISAHDVTIPASDNTDTKNTAGSTDTSSKIYLIGATSQAANPQTYSQDTAYVGTDGCLYSGGVKVLTAHQDISGKLDSTATAVKARGLIYIEGNSGGTAGTWTGTSSDITEYYDGLMIAYLVQTAGLSGGTTLNINGLGAVTCVRQATTGVSTSYPVGSVLIMIYKTYNSTHYWSVYDNTGSDTKVRQTLTTASSNRPLLMSYSANTDTTANTDNVSYRCNDIYANPSTGAIYATKFYENGSDVSTLYQSKHTTATVSIATTDWSSNACTKSVTGVTASNTIFVSPAPASFSTYSSAGIYCSAQAAGTLTFTCSTTPTAAITVNVVIMS